MATKYIDPESGDDTKDGTSWANAWKKLTGHSANISAGDTILVKKSPETDLSSHFTCSCTKGSRDVTPSSDPTAHLSQYDILRFDSENTIYMVRSVSASKIELYRPYRGESGSGKAPKKLTKFSVGSGDWKCENDGTSSSKILLKGGINTSNDSQDGFTVLDVGGGTFGFQGNSREWWEVSRLCMHHASYSWDGHAVGFKLKDCFGTRAGGFNMGLEGCEAEGLVLEDDFVSGGPTFLDTKFTDLEIFPCSGYSCISAYRLKNVIFIRYKNGHGEAGLNLKDYGSQDMEFIDSVFGEAQGHSSADIRFASSATHFTRLLFRNCKFNSSNLFGFAVGSYKAFGNVLFEHFNQTENDHRVASFNEFSGRYKPKEGAVSVYIKREKREYKNSAPSVKVELNQASHPVVCKHLIPCEANQQKTISVWLRKNSSYGSSTRPKMKLKWITGSFPNITWNEHEVEIPDENDTWKQVSYSVTPSVKGAIEVEIIFQSSNAGAIAWYDDLEVQ